MGHIQDLLDTLVTGGLGYERNVDLHLGPPFGVEGQKFLDDGEDDRTRIRPIQMLLDPPPAHAAPPAPWRTRADRPCWRRHA